MNKKEIKEHLASQDLDYIRSLVRGLGLRVFREKEPSKKVISKIETYIKNANEKLSEIRKDTDKWEFKDITPKNIKSKLENGEYKVRVYNDKKGRNGVQFIKSYFNKFQFRDLNQYNKFLDKLEDFDYYMRIFLSALKGDVSADSELDLTIDLEL